MATDSSVASPPEQKIGTRPGYSPLLKDMSRVSTPAVRTLATDASRYEVSSLLPGTSPAVTVDDERSPKPSILELAPIDASAAAALHTRVALLVHTALGFRYCLLPLSALAVSGSVPAVSATLAPLRYYFTH
eukprot:COSAG06_NODE_1731_length_8560_cov_24.811488_5_plen_132_part_00